MKFLQKSAAFVLILAMVVCLFLPGGLVLQANAAENVVYTVADFLINPLYADVISESDLLHSPPTLGADPDGQAEDPEYVTAPELIYEKFGNDADIVIDGGIGGLLPSTVVNCCEDEPEINRQGKGILNE